MTVGAGVTGVGDAIGATRAAPVPLGARVLLGAVLVVCAVAFLATGSVVLALAPALAVVVGYAFWTLPLRYPVYALFTAAIVIDIPKPWSPLMGVYDILFENLHKVTGISALRVSGLEVALGALGALALVRTLVGRDIDRRGRWPGASPMYAVAAGAFVAVLGMEVWGLSRGGDVRQSLWQFRQLVWLPITVGIFSYSLRRVEDMRVPAVLLTVAAIVKLAIGAHHLILVAWPAGESPPTMTGHSDSVIFVTVTAIWVTAWVHAPSRGRLFSMLTVTSFMMAALVLNNRRIAFVSLLGGMAVLFIILRGPVKRAMVRAIVLSIPLVAMYLLAGRNRSTGIFKPASLIMSVADQKDASSKTRDIENYNLMQTLKPNILLGSGWGHEYNELVVAYDISQAFAQYKFIAHNSVLWLLSIGGMVGFSLVWLPLGVGVFLARRSYYAARNHYDRTVAAVCLTIFLAYMVQAWGDMGTQSAIIMLVLAWAFAATGKLAIATGAWPAGARLIAFRRVAAPVRAPRAPRPVPQPHAPPAARGGRGVSVPW